MNHRHRTASAEIEGKILASALRILDERGVDALTVRGIASEAGVSPMGLYNRFEGKLGVYEALWTEGFDRLADAMGSVTESSDPRADLFVCGRTYRHFARTNTSHYRLMFMNSVNAYTPSAAAAMSAARALQTLVSRIERAQVLGSLPQGRSIDLAQSFWAAVHGFVSLEILDMNFAEAPEQSFDALLAAIYDGLASSRS